MNWLLKPWPWYVAGPLIGLIVPLLLILGNKSFGISSSFRHICASSFPNGIKFFKYDWKKEVWNLYFVAGLFLGGVILQFFFNPFYLPSVHPELLEDMKSRGLVVEQSWVPLSLFSKGNWFLMMIGGFLVGFGARYAGGCTSGHAIMGLSSLQWPSLITVIFFMTGGILGFYFLVPLFF